MRYKKAERENIDKAIHDANIIGLTINGTIQFVMERTGITIGHTQLVDRKRILKLQGESIWNKYRKDDYAYRLEHLDRMTETKHVIEQSYEKMLQFKDEPNKFWQWRNSAYMLLEAVKTYSDLHAAIPEIDAIGYEDQQKIPEIQPTEQGSLATQKGRVF